MTLNVLLTIALFVGVIYASPSPLSSNSLEDKIATWIEKQEIDVDLPFGSAVTLNARNLENDEINFKVHLPQEQARKSKLKKIIAPIFILVIIKAITLIPLALGIIGLKTWNAIQLSFVTFVTSMALAVYELCKKMTADHVHPVVSHSAPWPARSFQGQGEGQGEGVGADAAYSAYTQA